MNYNSHGEYDIKDSQDRQRMVDDYWGQATEGLEEENLRFAENFRFYCGGDGQWDSESIATLDEEGRPRLSINKCLSYLNTISGYQRKFRDTLTVFPRRGGTQNTARLLTELGRHAMDSARPSGDLCISEAFLMSIIGGKWWIGWREVFSDDPINGDIAPESVSYIDVLEDPLYRGYDIDENNPYNFCRFLFRNWYLEPAQIKKLWPDKAEEIEWFNTKATAGGYDDYILHGVSNDYSTRTGRDYSKALSLTPGYSNVIRYLVRRCFYKDWQTKYVIFNQATGEKFNLDTDVERAKSLVQASQNLRLFFHTVPVLHQTTMLGHSELDHVIDPFNGISKYPLTRICPYWVDGYPMGMIDNLKDPQRELNKSRSQILAHLNQSNNSGWLIQEGSVDEEKLQDYEKSTAPGWIGEYKPGFAPPQKLEPASLSNGHVMLAKLSEEDFDKITNINDAVTGLLSGEKESGEALKTRRDQGLTASEVVFDNFNQSQVALYDNLTERIRTPNVNGSMLYSEEEIINIVQEHNLPMSEEDIYNMQNGRYGLKVGRSEAHPTARQENFQQMLAFASTVPQAQEIDILAFLDASDLNNKEIMIQAIQAKRQQELQMALAQQQGALMG